MSKPSKLKEDPTSVGILREILAAAESAYNPKKYDGWFWANLVDPQTGEYLPDAIESLADPLAENIITSMRDGFLVWHDDETLFFDFSDEQFSAIIADLEADRAKLTRVLSMLAEQRTKRRKPS